MTPKSEVFNIDCMEGMKQFADNHFELSIVDPPYGIGFGEFNRIKKDSNGVRYKADKYKNSKWDSLTPDNRYFIELKRVSVNVIVWGGNYFPELWKEGCRGFIFWHKGNPVNNFSDGELAYTSFNKPAKQIDYRYFGNIEGKTSATKKIHPTQKPVALYEWLLMNYAKEGDKILDTHLGSGSSRIAAYKMGFDFTGYELDNEYFDASCKRFESQRADLDQYRVFTEATIQEVEQIKIEL